MSPNFLVLTAFTVASSFVSPNNRTECTAMPPFYSYTEPNVCPASQPSLDKNMLQQYSSPIKRPYWDFIGRYIPAIGDFFTNQEIKAKAAYSREANSKQQGTPLHPIDTLPPQAITRQADIRMWPLIIGVIIISFIIVGLFIPRYTRKAQNLIPFFYFLFIIAAVVDGIGIVLGVITTMLFGNFSYFIAMSNLWYGETALHVYVFLAELIIAILIYIYLRVIDYEIGNGGEKIIDRFVSTMFKLFVESARIIAICHFFYMLFGVFWSFAGIHITNFMSPIIIATFGDSFGYAILYTIDLVYKIFQFLFITSHYRVISGFIFTILSFIPFINSIYSFNTLVSMILGNIIMILQGQASAYLMGTSKNFLIKSSESIKKGIFGCIRFRNTYGPKSRISLD